MHVLPMKYAMFLTGILLMWRTTMGNVDEEFGYIHIGI